MDICKRSFELFLVFCFALIITFLSSISLAKEQASENISIVPFKMNSPLLSPDGKSLAFTTGTFYNRIIVVLDLETKQQVSMGNTEGSYLYNFHWANADRLLLRYNLEEKNTPQYARRHFRKEREEREAKLLEELEAQGGAADPEEGDNGLPRLVLYIAATRMISITKDLNESLNLLRQTTRNRQRIVMFQDDIIDMLNDDPEHILLNVDGYTESDSFSYVRRVNVADGTYELVKSSLGGQYEWKTDQFHLLRYGIGYSWLDVRATGDQIRKPIYLNPLTNEWVGLDEQSWFKDGGKLLDFSEDPKLAYIKTSDDTLILYNLVEDKVEQTIDQDVSTLAYTIGLGSVGGVPIGYWLNTGEPHYFYERNMELQNLIDDILPNGENIIVSAVENLEKYIIFNQIGEDKGWHKELLDGSYYLLDLQRGSLDKLMDRY